MILETRILDTRLSAPEYATDGAAAVDLRACSINGRQLFAGEKSVIAPGERVSVGTGIAIHLGSMAKCMSFDDPIRSTDNYAAMILPRSGLGAKGITIGNAPGLIDGDYQGEIKLALWNSGGDFFVIETLMRLAQMVIVPVIRPTFKIVAEFSALTERGAGGFGSTGHG